MRLMLNKLKFPILILVIVASGMILLHPGIVHAAADPLTGDACAGINALQDGKTDNTTCASGSGSSINKILAFTINVFSAVVGFIAVIMVIVGGMRFMTANGDSSKVASARSGIVYALIGLVIVALAQVLVHYVIERTNDATACATNPAISASDAKCLPATVKPPNLGL